MARKGSGKTRFGEERECKKEHTEKENKGKRKKNSSRFVWRNKEDGGGTKNRKNVERMRGMNMRQGEKEDREGYGNYEKEGPKNEQEKEERKSCPLPVI